MSPDINLRSYYLQFIRNIKVDLHRYGEELKELQRTKENIYEYIKENKNIILNDFNINLENYKEEYIDKKYNTSERLYQTILKLTQIAEEHPNRIVLLQVLKYCNILRNENKYYKLIELCNKRKDIKFTTYRKIVSNYYNEVHRCLLEGLGYKFSHGIGTYCINYWKLDKTKLIKSNRIDYAATNERKRELLKKGVKLYDDKEAAWYKARNIPYDGVDYRVFRTDDYFYEFVFINSNICRANALEYQRTEYVASKYRGMSYKEIADTVCNNIDDIVNLQVDIRYKLNILLHKYPTKYLNFIRNVEQDKHKNRADYCKNRQ